ncbi:MAG: hypothetical protein IJS09_10285 [Treponema sp.]|nr:hypothetical protein [Treponema sp.]
MIGLAIFALGTTFSAVAGAIVASSKKGKKWDKSMKNEFNDISRLQGKPDYFPQKEDKKLLK